MLPEGTNLLGTKGNEEFSTNSESKSQLTKKESNLMAAFSAAQRGDASVILAKARERTTSHMPKVVEQI